MYTTTKPDRNRARNVVFYGRVSTEHEAQISALENQLQWYDDQARYHPNWNIIGKYIDEGITGTQAKKRPSFLRMIEDAASTFSQFRVTVASMTFTHKILPSLLSPAAMYSGSGMRQPRLLPKLNNTL